MKILLIGLLIIALTTSLKHTDYRSCVQEGDIKYHHDYGVCTTTSDILNCYNNLENLIPNPETEGHIVDMDPVKDVQYHQDEITFTVETRENFSSNRAYGRGLNFAMDLESLFNSSPEGAEGDGYCKKSNPQHPINNQSMCQGTQFNSIWKFELTWDDKDTNLYGFRFGMDFKLGFAVQLDGVWEISETNNIQWDDNFENSTAQQFKRELQPGKHTLIAYGQEPFTSELGKGYTIEFHIGEKDAWETLTIENFNDRLPGYSKTEVGTPFSTTETMYYKVILSYLNGFNFDDECLTQVITVEDKQLPRGQAAFNQWAIQDNKSIFTLKHDDLVNYYGCSAMELINQTLIECRMKVEYFMGTDQQVQKGFHLDVVIDKENEDEAPIVTILPKPIIENNYDYTLPNSILFCEDLQCTKLLNRSAKGISVTERHHDFYIKHSLDTDNAEDFTLFYHEILVNGLSPNKKLENRKDGFTIYQVQNNFSGDSLEVEVISRLSGSKNLELIRAHEKIQVIDPLVQAEQQKEEEEYIKNTKIYYQYQECEENASQVPLAIALTAIFSLLVGLIIGGLALFIYHYKQAKKQQKSDEAGGRKNTKIDQVIDTNLNTEGQQLPSQFSSRAGSRRPSECQILQE